MGDVGPRDLSKEKADRYRNAIGVRDEPIDIQTIDVRWIRVGTPTREAKPVANMNIAEALHLSRLLE